MALAKPRKRKTMIRLPTSNVEISRVEMLMVRFQKGVEVRPQEVFEFGFVSYRFVQRNLKVRFFL